MRLREFFCREPTLSQDGSYLADTNDCGFWSGRYSVPLWVAGLRANARREHLSARDPDRKSHWMLFSWPNRAIYAEPYGHFAGLAHGHRNWILRRVYDVFEFRVGDSKNAGRRRVAARDDVRECQRDCGLALV